MIMNVANMTSDAYYAEISHAIESSSSPSSSLVWNCHVCSFVQIFDLNTTDNASCRSLSIVLNVSDARDHRWTPVTRALGLWDMVPPRSAYLGVVHTMLTSGNGDCYHLYCIGSYSPLMAYSKSRVYDVHDISTQIQRIMMPLPSLSPWLRTHILTIYGDKRENCKNTCERMNRVCVQAAFVLVNGCPPPYTYCISVNNTAAPYLTEHSEHVTSLDINRTSCDTVHDYRICPCAPRGLV